MHSTSLETVVEALALALGRLAVMANTASIAQTARFKGNGAFVEMEGHDSTGCIYLYVCARRGGTTQAPETFLHYEIYNECTSQSLGWGSGRVANVAFRTPKKGSATLILSPTASADFDTGGIPGSVSITWTIDRVESSRYWGNSRTEYAATVRQVHGSWTTQTAKAAGTILGFEIGDTSTQIGEGRDRCMEIERSK